MSDREISCQGKEADIVLIIDQSSSIWNVDFERQQRFLADLISHFDINSGKTRISMIVFSDKAEVVFYLDQYKNTAEITEAILSVESQGGITNTHMALEMMLEEVLTKEHGSRPSVAHICILITDGRSKDPTKTIAAAKSVHDKGVYVFAIGVGNMTDATELKQMASDGGYSVEVKNGYKALKKIKRALAFKACEVPQGDQSRCSKKLHADIVFGLLNIGGVARVNVSAFMKKVGGGFDLASGKVRIGLVENCGRAEFQVQEFENSAMYGSAITQAMETDISTMLLNIRTSYLPSKFDKIDSSTIIILLVSGTIHDMEKAEAEVRRLKYKAMIIVVGIDPSADFEQLKQLATYKDRNVPDSTHVFHLNNPYELFEIIKQIHQLMCSSQ